MFSVTGILFSNQDWSEFCLEEFVLSTWIIFWSYTHQYYRVCHRWYRELWTFPSYLNFKYKQKINGANFLCPRKELDRTILLSYTVNSLLFVVNHFLWIPWVCFKPWISCFIEKNWIELFYNALLWICHYSWNTIFREFHGSFQTTKLRIQWICVVLYLLTLVWDPQIYVLNENTFFSQTTKIGIHNLKWIHNNCVLFLWNINVLYKW